MKNTLKCLALCAISTVVLAGCRSRSPYDYGKNWLIREDAVLTIAAPADVIYLQNELYSEKSCLPSMFAHAKAEVGNGRFVGMARIFSPLISSAEDLEQAIEWYLKNQHEKGHPFVFIGEGEAGRFLWAYESTRLEELKEAGFIGGFYTDEVDGHFVTDEMLKNIKRAIVKGSYRNIWGREMPTK